MLGFVLYINVKFLYDAPSIYIYVRIIYLRARAFNDKAVGDGIVARERVALYSTRSFVRQISIFIDTQFSIIYMY